MEAEAPPKVVPESQVSVDPPPDPMNTSSSPVVVTAPGPSEAQPETVVPPRSWKSVVAEDEEARLQFDKEYLRGKIVVWHIPGSEAEPIITIAEEVVSALATEWTSSLVIKTLGTMVPYDIMNQKLRDLWKPSGKLKVIDLPNGYYVVKFSLDSDYVNAINGGPWSIFGHYVVVKPWSPQFNALTDVVRTTPVWVRLHDLPVQYYVESVLEGIARTIGEVARIDKQTLLVQRGRFARVCIHLDLTSPLMGALIVNGTRVPLQYEGLHSICFGCGCFGHFQPGCPSNPSNVAKKQEREAEKKKNDEAGGSPEKSKPWGAWMNPNQRRGPRKNPDKRSHGSTTSSATAAAPQKPAGRYAALAVDQEKGEDHAAQIESKKAMEGLKSVGVGEKVSQKSEKGKRQVTTEEKKGKGVSEPKKVEKNVLTVTGKEVAETSTARTKCNWLRKQARIAASKASPTDGSNEAQSTGPSKRARSSNAADSHPGDPNANGIGALILKSPPSLGISKVGLNEIDAGPLETSVPILCEHPFPATDSAMEESIDDSASDLEIKRALAPACS
ncbi:hypothetical protein V2J09_012486 [Rumex salicifolius]